MSAKQIANVLSAAAALLFPAQAKADEGQDPPSQSQAVATAPAALSTPPGGSQGVTQGASAKADDKNDDNYVPAPAKRTAPQVLLKEEAPFLEELYRECERNLTNRDVTRTKFTANLEMHIVRHEPLREQVKNQLENAIIAARDTKRDVTGNVLSMHERYVQYDLVKQANLNFKGYFTWFRIGSRKYFIQNNGNNQLSWKQIETFARKKTLETRETFPQNPIPPYMTLEELKHHDVIFMDLNKHAENKQTWTDKTVRDRFLQNINFGLKPTDVQLSDYAKVIALITSRKTTKRPVRADAHDSENLAIGSMPTKRVHTNRPDHPTTIAGIPQATTIDGIPRATW